MIIISNRLCFELVKTWSFIIYERNAAIYNETDE